ncbi:MAG TPA: response regulator transcription factor [Candidatus Angelobacter sp.]|jgi:DNA-binding NarL/FixJ family response regulator|nr:response regulator transcription factor [Candidatus Angelobacter sp.]
MDITTKTRVLIVDDHPLVRQGLAGIIQQQHDMTVIAEASCGREAIEHFRTHRPDLTVMDLRLPDMSGVEAMRSILHEFPDARIVILSSYEGDADIRAGLEAGARSYFLKGMDSKELVEEIRLVNAGKKRIPPAVAARLTEYLADDSLTKREIEVVKLIAGGKSNKEIGKLLFISEDTVKMHVKNILSKLQASDRTQAVTIALRRGIVQL